MPKPFTPVVIAANDLIEGTSVWLGPDGWTARVAEATVAHDAEAKAALEASAGTGEAANRVVGPYAVDVALEDGVPVPVKRRERIKASLETTVPVGAAAPAPRRDRRAA
ncbi:MAG: DUF2849 domain-containing protein [Paracoccaceae bacterium]